jgi:transcriptional regulator with PAS, ATPase and Fis domain
LLEVASGSTVFLDEIGEMSQTTQAKLLRVLETKRVIRVGDVREREIDIRLVAATNRNLVDEVRAPELAAPLGQQAPEAEDDHPEKIVSEPALANKPK